MIVYGSSLAPAARKVLAFSADKGLDAEHETNEAVGFIVVRI
jgi:hypothetical protein